VLICDNDNVRPNRTLVSGVFGTTGFMAPEIERREAMPSRQTDLFSLAVLLFWMFHVNHPLVGKKALAIRIFDLAAKEKLYGKEPLFIFDPNDRSNEAVDGKVDPLREAGANALQTWRFFPVYYRDCVMKAFTKGLRDPDARVTEGEWLAVLSRLRDSIFLCACGAENFYDRSATKISGGRPAPCWSCRKTPQLPFRIRISKSVVMLNFDSKLYRHHLDDQHELDYNQVVAEVVPHPTKPGIWGLRNCTQERWVATIPPGAALKDVEPGKSVPLASNTRVNFGRVEGEIRY
jgi:serine/threonine protein kinase